MSKYVKISIIDNEIKDIMDDYIIVVPDEEYIYYKEKLEELQEMLNDRFEEENEFSSDYKAIEKFIRENFEILDISEAISIEW